jgi:heme/copper-type cytochrome/quinol oxidase subunit 4
MQETPFNKSGNDLSQYIKDFFRYVFAVVLVSVAACLPLLTHNYYYILVASALLLFFDLIALRHCGERESKKWRIIANIQLAIVIADVVSIVLYLIFKNKILEHLIVYVNVGFSCIHSGFCFFDYRKDEPLVPFRYLGAMMVTISVLVVVLAKKWLNINNIFV